jgi:hypothetical protein
VIIPEFVNVKIMKATQLKNIIRESIKELMNENVSPGQTVAVAVATANISNPQDVPSPNYVGVSGLSTPFGIMYTLQPLNVQYGIPFAVTSDGCGLGTVFQVDTQQQANAFNSVFDNSIHGVYVEVGAISSNGVLNDLNSDFSNPVSPNISSVPQCQYVGSGGINVSGAGTPNLLNKVSTPPAAFAPNKVADPQLDPSTLPDTSARGVANSRMQKLANIKPNRK